MADTFGSRLKNAWNAFTSQESVESELYKIGPSYGVNPSMLRFGITTEKSIITPIYTRIAIDAAAIGIKHAKQDQNGRFIGDVESRLNNCLTLEANIDQTGRALIQDIVTTMFEHGTVAIVPVNTVRDPLKTDSFDILTIRVGVITQWYPKHIKALVYDDSTGEKREIILPKRIVAIVQNPLYSIMNEPNSTLKRLSHKLNLMDSVDDLSSSGKLDLIIQLPYVVKTEARREEAVKRAKDIEMQLTTNKYGIAYIDGTEKITQLNRSVENNLLTQVTYLTNSLYSQLGLTEEVFNGTADEKTMLNYYNRTIEPILSAITDSMKRVFLTKTARTQNQTIMFFRDPFRLVPVSELAEIADKFTRNEILSSNDVRAIIGIEPAEDPGADELRNKNLNKGIVSEPPILGEE